MLCGGAGGANATVTDLDDGHVQLAIKNPHGETSLMVFDPEEAMGVAAALFAVAKKLGIEPKAKAFPLTMTPRELARAQGFDLKAQQP